MTNVELTVARRAGLAYLALAISGIVGFLVIRGRLVDDDDAAATMANLVGQPGLARAGLAAMLTVVVSQSLAALYFFQMFRHQDSFAAGSLGVFGMMNAAAILVGTAFSATALDLALDVGPAESVGMLLRLEGATWTVGGLFFGLWLLPMGWLTIRSRTMPAALGWTLVAGGIGYVTSTYLALVAPGLSALAQAITLPATVGELWMVAYLLVRGGSAGVAGSAPVAGGLSVARPVTEVTPTRSDDAFVPVRQKLAALWTTVMFCFVYGDYFELYVPGKLGDMLNGEMALGEVTQPMLVGTAALMVVPSLMIALTVVLPVVVSRWLNVTVGLFYAAIMSAILFSGAWLFYAMFALVEISLMLMVVWKAWRWPGQRPGEATPRFSDSRA